ncbi:MAG: hypothetical protein JOZ47_01145 [Kutzneria sp.]|nr:hypothetical protein [Kutzneria sp.]
MTQQLSVKLADDLAERVRAAAGGNVSAWVQQALQAQLDREMWQRSKEIDALLGIDDRWTAEQMALREQARGQAVQ